MKNILTVDVEDWFHILELDTAPDANEWANLESRVESAFLKLLDEFEKADTKVTCFFLGWIAEQFPGLVREAHARGHEIASHGYSHQLVYRQTREEFGADLQKSKAILEGICGTTVKGYRAPGFSITEQTPWAFDEIARAGFEYDSSIFPASRGHGGLSQSSMSPYWVHTDFGSVLELPVSVAQVMGQRLCVFGGGYLRLAPYGLVKMLGRQVNDAGRPIIYYVHPREVDPDHPRIAMSLLRRFKSYVKLRSTMPKLRKILSNRNLVSFRQWIDSSNVESGLNAVELFSNSGTWRN